MLRISSLWTLLPVGVALAVGAAVPFQAASNAVLGRALGHPLWATVTSLSVSILVMLPVLLLMRVPAPSLAAAAQGPLWWWLGGLAGAAYVTAALILTPKLGAASFIVCVIAGQMLASLLIDHFGLMGIAPKPANIGRLVGIALMLLGMVVVQLSSQSSPAPAPATSAAASANSVNSANASTPSTQP